MAFITIGGVPAPYPNCDSGLQTQATMVDGDRNGSGVFIGQRVGRDQSKVELQWFVLDAATWASLLQVFEDSFVNPVEYYDMVKGEIVTRNMYVSDRTARPGKIDPDTGVWLTARDCKLNLIDTGG